MSKKKQNPDPFKEIRESQDHSLDPGYFTGGRIHPIYRSNRPNRGGWVLIVTGGVIALAFPWILLSGQASLFRAILIGAVAALHLAAGIRLVRGPKKRGAA